MGEEQIDPSVTPQEPRQPTSSHNPAEASSRQTVPDELTERASYAAATDFRFAKYKQAAPASFSFLRPGPVCIDNADGGPQERGWGAHTLERSIIRDARSREKSVLDEVGGESASKSVERAGSPNDPGAQTGGDPVRTSPSHEPRAKSALRTGDDFDVPDLEPLPSLGAEQGTCVGDRPKGQQLSNAPPGHEAKFKKKARPLFQLLNEGSRRNPGGNDFNAEHAPMHLDNAVKSTLLGATALDGDHEVFHGPTGVIAPGSEGPTSTLGAPAFAGIPHGPCNGVAGPRGLVDDDHYHLGPQAIDTKVQVTLDALPELTRMTVLEACKKQKAIEARNQILSTELREIRASLASVERARQSLAERESKTKQEAEAARTRIEELETETHRKVEELGETSRSLKLLQSDVHNLRLRMSEIVDDADALPLEIVAAHVHQALQETKRQAGESLAALAQAKLAIDSEKERAEQALFDRATVQDDMKELRAQLKCSEERATAEMQKVADGESELNLLRARLLRIDELEAVVKEKEDRLQELERQKQDLSARCEKRHEELQQQREELNRLLEKYEVLLQKYGDMQNSKTEADAKLEHADEKLANLARDLTAVSTKYQQLESDRVAIIADRDKYLAASERLERGYNFAFDQAERHQKEVSVLHTRLQAALSTAAGAESLQRRVEEKDADVKSCRTQLEQERRRLTAFEEAAKKESQIVQNALEARIKKLEDDLRRSDKELDSARRELDAERKRREDVNEEVSGFKHELACLKASHQSELERGTERLRQEVLELQAEREDREATIRRAIEEKEHRISEMECKIQSLQQTADDLAAELATAVRDRDASREDARLRDVDSQQGAEALRREQTVVNRFHAQQLVGHELRLVALVETQLAQMYAKDSANKDNEIKRLENERRGFESKLAKAQRDLEYARRAAAQAAAGAGSVGACTAQVGSAAHGDRAQTDMRGPAAATGSMVQKRMLHISSSDDPPSSTATEHEANSRDDPRAVGFQPGPKRQRSPRVDTSGEQDAIDGALGGRAGAAARSRRVPRTYTSSTSIHTSAMTLMRTQTTASSKEDESRPSQNEEEDRTDRPSETTDSGRHHQEVLKSMQPPLAEGVDKGAPRATPVHAESGSKGGHESSLPSNGTSTRRRQRPRRRI